MYLKKTELEQALRENMQSTLENYGGDSIAEDVSVWDYVIKGVNGELYPCKPDIFEKTYENI